MTIGIGLLCTDGLVLATDTKYTQGDFKSHGPKLFPIINRPDLAVVIAGAGNVPFMRRAIDKLEVALSQLQNPSTEDVRMATENVLLEFFNQRIYPRPDWWHVAFELILGVWTERDGFILLSSNEVNVGVPMPKHATGPCCIGFGQHVSEYALGLTFQTALNVEHAKFVAAFAIKAAKDHVASCGGQTRIYAIRKMVSGCHIETIRRKEISEIETHSRQIYQSLGVVLGVLEKIRPDEDETVGIAINAVKEAILEFRAKRRDYRERVRKIRERA